MVPRTVPELIAITKRRATRAYESNDTRCTPEKFGTATREGGGEWRRGKKGEQNAVLEDAVRRNL